MRSPVPFPILLIFLLAVVGCGDDDGSPSTPEPDPEIVETLHIRAELLTFECIFDGDGVEGAGDFNVLLRAISTVWEFDATLNDGQSRSLGFVARSERTYSGRPAAIEILFNCIEWDTDILGNDFPDSDMNALEKIVEVEVDGGDEVTGSITLGNDNCKVRLHYEVTGTVVQEEVP